MSLTHPRSSLSSSITPCLKVRYQCREQESPSFSTDGALCLWRRNRKTDRRGGKKIKSIAFIWLLFKMLILAKQMLLILFLFFSLTVCKRTALGFSLFKTKYNNSFNGKHWLWASIKKRSLSQMWIYGNERCVSHPIHHLSSRIAKGRGKTSPRITAVITYLLHGHACQFRVQLVFCITP